MKAVILAAGEGVRLRPLTETRPKHMIKIAGKPILEYCLEAIRACGIRDVVIVVNYMADKIQGYFGNGEKIGLNIEYAYQESIIGTGNAVTAAEPYVSGDFLLVYGDLLFTAKALEKVLDTHKDNAPTATMAVVKVDNPEEFGIVETAAGGRVKRIIEKPRREEAPSNMANAGIYVFSEEIFEKARKIKASSRGEWEITDAITLMANDGACILTAEIPISEWCDVGRPWDLLEANRWALSRMEHKVLGAIEDGAHLIGPVSVAKNTRIRSGAYIEGPVFIDEGSDIGPNCYIRPYTSIGKRTRIGNACEIKNSIIMDGTHIGHLSYVGDSIIGENCNFGAGTITANYRLDAKNVKMMVKDRLIDTGRRKLGAILGDNVKTGVNALFMPGVKIGSNSWIGPNVIVNRDVPSNTIILLKQNLEEKTRNFNETLTSKIL
ncbi:NTP transferase domain-containing protein [Candidatus Bathyarchaeota archaeon]|nr:NTP transferase domain-containing protein [Candidatus Bathyarchaeota archaeon]